MNSGPLTDKWQRIAAIVQEHSALSTDLSQRFKKVFLTRYLAANLLVFLLQFSGLMFSTFSYAAMPVWFASGTACAFTFMRGFSILPGIGLGSLLAGVVMHFSLGSSLIMACIFTLQAYGLTSLSIFYIQPYLVFYSAKNLLTFILSSSLCSLAVGFLLSYLLQQNSLWLNWSLANFNGIMIVALALGALDAYFPDFQKFKSINKIMLFWLYALIISAFILFVLTKNDLFFLSIVPLIIIINSYFGWCGVVVANFLIGLILTLSCYFELYSASLLIQVLLALQTIVTLFIARPRL